MNSVLMIGEAGDWSIDVVAAELASRGVASFRFDTAEFPGRAQIAARFDPESSAQCWQGTIRSVDGTVAIENVAAVYYRKPRDFELSSRMSEPERRFARAQARVGIGGVLSSVRGRWVNHPAAVADAEYKPRQIAIAARCGLPVPATLITNDPDEVRAFASARSRLIVKPLAAPIVHEGGGFTSIYTRLVGEADFVDLGGVDTTAHLFQEFVEKEYEVRLTAIGDRLFTVAIPARSQAAQVDWRTDYDSLTYEVVECPHFITSRIGRFLESCVLVYGAFDFVVRPDGEWVFLECNSGGQWGWLAEECGLPIAAAIAEALIEGLEID